MSCSRGWGGRDRADEHPLVLEARKVIALIVIYTMDVFVWTKEVSKESKDKIWGVRVALEVMYVGLCERSEVHQLAHARCVSIKKPRSTR